MSTSTLADPLYERLHRVLPGDQAYTPADWDTDAMPGPVRHYLTHLLRHQRQQEAARLRRARTGWVDYDHPEMEQATRTFFEAAEDHMQVPPDQWDETLQTAVRRATDHLVRPVPTLTSFVFEDPSEPVPVPRIQWRMRFFGPYAYLRNAVEAYAEKRERDAFEADVYERILRRIDERMTDDFDAERWLRLLDPLFETAQCATGHEEVPRSLLVAFFEEKNAARIVDRLDAHDADTVAPDALRRLIDATPTPSSSEASEASPAPETEPPLPADLPETSSPEASPSEDGEGVTPMWKQFEQSRPRRSNKPDENDGSQPLWTQFRAQQSSASTPPDTDTPSGTASDKTPDRSESAERSEHGPTLSALEREVFGDNTSPNRTVYVRELFGGDGEAYREVLERLRRTGSWSTASQIIARDVFRAHQVNIYSDAAVHFTDAVEAGFQNE